MDDNTKGGLTQFWGTFHRDPLRAQRFQTFGSQIETVDSLKTEKLSYDFLLKALRDSKVRAAKDHGKKFRSEPVPFFVICFVQSNVEDSDHQRERIELLAKTANFFSYAEVLYRVSQKNVNNFYECSASLRSQK